MKVYLVRHGAAEPQREGGDDAERPLTAAGSQALVGVALGLRSLGVGLDRLFTSPLLRAQQSAAILAEGLDGPEPEELYALAPGHDPDEILGQLAQAGERVAVVGHQPTLGMLVSLAVAGSAGGGVALSPGGVAYLEFSGAPRAGAGRLRWLLDTEQLGRLGSASSG